MERYQRLMLGHGLLVILVIATLILKVIAQNYFPRLEMLYDRFLGIAAIALIVTFAPELRRLLIRLGEAPFFRAADPEVPRIIPLDLGMLRAVVRLIRLVDARVDLRSLVLEVTRFIELELDFGREVTSMTRLGADLAGRDDVVVPRAIPEACGESTITMERLDGVQVANRAGLEAAGRALDALAVVEVAYIQSLGVPPPGDIAPPTPDLFVDQSYWQADPGLDFDHAWTQGYRGNGVRISDCEYGWNHAHEDLVDLDRLPWRQHTLPVGDRLGAGLFSNALPSDGGDVFQARRAAKLTDGRPESDPPAWKYFQRARASLPTRGRQ